MSLFSTTAPAYYAAGIPVIPLHYQDKRPAVHGWNKYADEMPTAEEQAGWIKSFPNGNIGLVLGKTSNVSVMDIDTVDPVLIEKITNILPRSPWVRIGKKGMVIAYRYSGIKTFRIKTSDGQSLCEFLSDRTQVVLPPSIHPDTKRPYTANCELLDVIGTLPECPSDLEDKLRRLLEEAGVKLSSSGWSKITEYVAPGTRDLNLTEKAGLFAYAVMRGDRSLKEAIGMLRSYNEEFVQTVAGDPMDIEKHVKNLVLFLHRDIHVKKKVLPEGWDKGLTDEDKIALGVNFDKDMEEWKADEIQGYLRKQFEVDGGDGGPDSMAAVEKMLVKISHSKNLTELEKDRLVNYMAKVSGCGLQAANLRKHIRVIKQGEGLLGVNHSEVANALLEDLEQFYPICHTVGKFWKYNGGFWEVMDDAQIIAKISENYGHLPAAKKHGDMRGVLALLASIVPQELSSMQGEVRRVNFANGVLIMDRNGTKQLRPHDASYGMTYVMPFRYLAEDGEKINLQKLAPRFTAFLEQSWGQDPDYSMKVKALQEMMAVTLFGQGSAYQRAFLLHGAPSSGKSQLLKIVSSLVPDEAKSAVNPADWSSRFAPSMMYKKLLNIAGELSGRRQIDGQRFKDIVDGSEIMGEYKFKDAFRFCITCTHWFASNHFPRTEDSSEGFTRRWLVLDFRHPVPVGKRVVGLGDEIVAQEREIIAAWAVEGMQRLLTQTDYTLPTSHLVILDEMANMNNVVRAFLYGCKDIVVGEGGEMDELTLFNLFWAYNMATTQQKAPSVPEFRAKLRELAVGGGFSVEGKEAVRYVGIKKATRK